MEERPFKRRSERARDGRVPSEQPKRCHIGETAFEHAWWVGKRKHHTPFPAVHAVPMLAAWCGQGGGHREGNAGFAKDVRCGHRNQGNARHVEHDYNVAPVAVSTHRGGHGHNKRDETEVGMAVRRVHVASAVMVAANHQLGRS
jgi:hypothetical protein